MKNTIAVALIVLLCGQANAQITQMYIGPGPGADAPAAAELTKCLQEADHLPNRLAGYQRCNAIFDSVKQNHSFTCVQHSDFNQCNEN